MFTPAVKIYPKSVRSWHCHSLLRIALGLQSICAGERQLLCQVPGPFLSHISTGSDKWYLQDGCQRLSLGVHQQPV